MGIIHGRERTAHEIEMDNREAEAFADARCEPARPRQPEPEPCDVCGTLWAHDFAIHAVYEKLLTRIVRLEKLLEKP